MVFNAAPCIQYYTRPPAFLFSAHANHLLLHPLHRASRDSRRAATRPGEQDSCGEIELNLEMNIESNELSTSQPPQNHPLNLLCLVGVPRPLRFSLASGAFLRSPIGTIDSFRVIYLLAFEIEIEVDITSNRRR